MTFFKQQSRKGFLSPKILLWQTSFSREKAHCQVYRPLFPEKKPIAKCTDHFFQRKSLLPSVQTSFSRENACCQVYRPLFPEKKPIAKCTDLCSQRKSPMPSVQTSVSREKAHSKVYIPLFSEKKPVADFVVCRSSGETDDCVFGEIKALLRSLSGKRLS